VVLKVVLSDVQLEQLVARRIQATLPGTRLVSNRVKMPGRRGVDFILKDKNGVIYYGEVRANDCNRIDIGRAIELKAQISKTSPRAKLILICRNISEEIKKILENVGINSVSFKDIGLSADIVARRPRAPKHLSPIEERAYFGSLKKGNLIMTTSELASLLHISKPYSMKLLASLNRKGIVFRIGRGKYVVIPADTLYERKGFVGDPVMIAGKLLSGEYYVAYQSAANIHGLAEQLPTITTIAIPYRKRAIAIGNSRLEFVTIKEDRFSWGIQEMKYGDAMVRVSDLQRTILDCIDRSDLCGGFSEVVRIIANALEQPEFDAGILIDYARRFGNRAVIQRLGFALEKLRKAETHAMIKSLDRMKSDYTYALDPRLKPVGPISEKWHIIENAPAR
jgi:predicted transcriptional regulator of viral defense system